MYHEQKDCLDSCFLRLISLSRSLFLLLIQQFLFKILINVYRVLFRVQRDEFLSYSKRKDNQPKRPLVHICCHSCYSLSLIIILCHSLSLVPALVVTRFTTCCHSLSLILTGTTRCHLLSLTVTGCTTRSHWLSLLITRCVTHLSFYKRSKVSFVNIIG